MTWNRTLFWSNYVTLHGMLRCELCGWKHPCEHGYEAHHIISRQMTKGNKKARRYTERKWWVFMASLCPFHNKLADCWDARYILLDKRVLMFGEAAVGVAISELLELMKSDIPELRRYLEVNDGLESPCCAQTLRSRNNAGHSRGLL